MTSRADKTRKLQTRLARHDLKLRHLLSTPCSRRALSISRSKLVVIITRMYDAGKLFLRPQVKKPVHRGILGAVV